MRIRGFTTLFAVVLGLAAGARPARAEFFDFSTTVTLSNPTAGSVIGGGNGTSSVVLDTPGAGDLTITGENSSAVPHTTATGNGSQIVYSTLTFAGLDATTPASPIGYNFVYNLTLTDYATATSTTPLGTGVVSISGRWDGSIGPGEAANLDTLTDYTVSPASITIGGFQYNIALGSPGIGFFVTPPGPTNPGTMGARITVAVPEPGSVVLLGLGGLGLVGVSRRWRRPIR